MSITTELRWGWVTMYKDIKPQLETFKTPTEAILAMQKRQGEDFQLDMQDMANAGLRLALVRVTVEPLMVFQDVEKTQP